MKVRMQRKAHKVTIVRGSDSATFEGMPMDPAENEKLRRKYNNHVKIKGQIMPDPDWMGFKLEKVRRVIVGWDGIIEENGKVVECTDKNKEELYLLNPDIVDEALGKFDEIAAGIAEIEEEKKTI